MACTRFNLRTHRDWHLGGGQGIDIVLAKKIDQGATPVATFCKHLGYASGERIPPSIHSRKAPGKAYSVDDIMPLRCSWISLHVQIFSRKMLFTHSIAGVPKLDTFSSFKYWLPPSMKLQRSVRFPLEGDRAAEFTEAMKLSEDASPPALFSARYPSLSKSPTAPAYRNHLGEF